MPTENSSSLNHQCKRINAISLSYCVSEHKYLLGMTYGLSRLNVKNMCDNWSSDRDNTRQMQINSNFSKKKKMSINCCDLCCFNYLFFSFIIKIRFAHWMNKWNGSFIIWQSRSRKTAAAIILYPCTWTVIKLSLLYFWISYEQKTVILIGTWIISRHSLLNNNEWETFFDFFACIEFIMAQSDGMEWKSNF